MPGPNPTVGELFTAKTVSDYQVNTAVDAYQADPGTTANPIADGYSLDLAAAVEAHPFARATLSEERPTPSRKRKAVRAAILLARAQKA
jgi:hypothetical protein